MTFPIISILKKVSPPLRVAYFDSTNYGFGGYHVDYELQNFEYEWKGIFQSGSSRIWGVNQSNINPRRSGHILISSGTFPGFQYANSNSSNINIFHTTTTASLEGNLVVWIFKKFGTNYEFTINGILKIGSITDTIIYNSGEGTGTYVGRRSVPSTPLPFIGTMNYCKYYELNSSGVRINDLINYDFNNGDAYVVPNTATDKPASSDMTWMPEGSGVYI